MALGSILSRSVRDHLVAEIEAGRLAPGLRLPTERALAEEFSATRAAVRDAFAAMEGEGRIVRVPGSGAYVAGADPARGSASVGLAASPAQVMEARLAFEPAMAHLVVLNATAADFERFETCVSQGGKAEAMEGFEHWDAALHEAIAEAARNPLVVASYRLVTRARDRAEWGELKRRSLTAERRAFYQEEHVRIVAALRRRDAAEAEAEIRAHLKRVRSNLLGN